MTPAERTKAIGWFRRCLDTMSKDRLYPCVLLAVPVEEDDHRQGVFAIPTCDFSNIIHGLELMLAQMKAMQGGAK